MNWTKAEKSRGTPRGCAWVLDGAVGRETVWAFQDKGTKMRGTWKCQWAGRESTASFGKTRKDALEALLKNYPCGLR